MKKLTLLPLLVAALLAGCTELPPDNQKEQEFNNSGRAKAIEKPEDLWMHYEDSKTGFSVKYPHNVALNEEAEDYELSLRVESTHIDLLDSTMGFDTETAKANREALSAGEYGKDVDWPIEESKKVLSKGDTKAQKFMVLGRFEVCDITFERFLYFFHNDHQVVISLTVDKGSIIEENPEFFTINPENCGEELAWDSEKQGEFYEKLESGEGSESSQEWFDTFDAIVNTIEFFEGTGNDPLDDIAILLKGTWVSTDDPLSSIVFENNIKADIYDGEQVFQGTFELTGTDEPHLVVEDGEETFEYAIMDVSEESLSLMYLPRGNILEFVRSSTNHPKPN